jgi:thiamine biosynthesis lipoprotein
MSPPPEPLTLARQAMATRFEIVLHGDNPVSLRAAGEEAFDEIERIEARLSLYRPTSEIAHVNARAAREAVRVSPATFRLLEHAASLSAETDGAFDITIGPLMRCWGFIDGTGQVPAPEALAEARERTGMGLVELDAAKFTVRFAREGVMLDLGAIGKGYAVGVAAEILREAGVASALIHGGTSSVYAIGRPPDSDAWKIAIERPPDDRAGVSPASAGVPPARVFAGETPAATAGTVAPLWWQPQNTPVSDSQDAASALLAVVPLRDEAFSVSAVWGKSFQTSGRSYGHVIDPRTGQPADSALLAAVALPDATETDALSTALLTLGGQGLEFIARLRPGCRALAAWVEDGRLRSSSHAIALGG